MRLRRKLNRALQVLCLPLGVVLASAYEHPLNSFSVWDAYLLGRGNSEKTAAFLAPYTQHLPLPKTGPYVSRIGVETPFVQMVVRARQQLNYDPQTAEQDYRAHPDAIVVFVSIEVTPTYVPGVLHASDFWRDFRITVEQGRRRLQPAETTGKVRYTRTTNLSSVSGADIELRFAASQVASALTAVHVLTPEGQQVHAEFDLQHLR